MLGGDVADQLLDDDGLADTCATEDADLSALRERADEVDDLDARLEDLGLGRLLIECGRRAMDRQNLGRGDRALVVDRLAEDVEDSTQRALADRDSDRSAGVLRGRAAGQTVCGGHGDAADPVIAQMLLDLADDLDAVAAHDFYGVVDARQPSGREFDVDDRAGDLDHAAGGRAGCGWGGCRHRRVGASCGRCAARRRLWA